MKVSIIGVGRLGGALALALVAKGYKIEFFASRTGEQAEAVARLIEPKPRILAAAEFEKIRSGVVFITTQDPQIRGVARSLAVKLKHRPVVFHTSGSLSSEILDGLRKIGCPVGSLHPLVSVSDARRGAASFKNAYFCVEGDAKAVALGKRIVKDLGGDSFSVETKFKALYHASAVTAAGHLTALFGVALEMLAACGLGEEEARKVLLPLAKSAVNNLSSQTPAEALTGTFARADVETLKLHLEILAANVSPETLEIYRQLGFRSLDLAQAQGAERERLSEMRKMLIANG